MNAVKFKRWMLAGAKYALLAAVTIGAVGYYQQRNIPQGAAPELAGTTLAGKSIDLHRQVKDGPVLIYFWATWCGYCRVVSPAVSEIAQSHRVISVALQSGGEAELSQYLQRHNLTFPTLSDPEGQLGASWGLRVTPTIVIVGRDGRVRWITSGVTSKWGLLFRLWLAR